jgi:PTS system mannose-specific IIA component
MIAILVFSHGALSTELLAAARTIDPDLASHSAALALPWDADSEEGVRLLRRHLKALNDGSGVLVLTDMFGGTATNLALPFLEPGSVEVITGVNLPMLVKAGNERATDAALPEIAERIAKAGQNSIHLASAYLERRSGTGAG